MGYKTKTDTRQMLKYKHMRTDIEFEQNLKKLMPEVKGMPERTRKLNKILEEMIYGIKK